jgi:hypothetical protein
MRCTYADLHALDVVLSDEITLSKLPLLYREYMHSSLNTSELYEHDSVVRTSASKTSSLHRRKPQLSTHQH